MDLFLMSAGTAIMVRVIAAHILLPVVFKAKVVGGNRRTERFLWQFVFTFIMAALIALVLGDLVVDARFWIVILVGAIAGSGTFFSWKATNISLSRNSLFAFWDDLIPMGLSYYFFHEGRFITAPVGVGIAMSILAVLGFIWYGRFQKSKKGELGTAPPLAFYLYVATYSVAWGLAAFAQRYWALKELSVPTFLFGWYIGTLIVAVLIFLFYKDKAEDQKSTAPLLLKDIVATFVVAVLILVSLGLALIAYRLPQVAVQPIFLVTEMVFPSLIGLFVFHERKQFARIEWLFFALGAAGALLVSVSI